MQAARQMMIVPTCSKLYISGIYLTPTPPREKKYAGGVIFWHSSSRQTVNKSNRSESERVKANSLHRGYTRTARQPTPPARKKRLTFSAWLGMQNKQIIKPL